jgi:aldehyde dehydrogenase (NAD+)
VAEGGELIQPRCRLPERGYWFAPTVLTGVTRATASRRRKSSARC